MCVSDPTWAPVRKLTASCYLPATCMLCGGARASGVRLLQSAVVHCPILLASVIFAFPKRIGSGFHSPPFQIFSTAAHHLLLPIFCLLLDRLREQGASGPDRAFLLSKHGFWRRCPGKSVQYVGETDAVAFSVQEKQGGAVCNTSEEREEVGLRRICQHARGDFSPQQYIQQ